MRIGIAQMKRQQALPNARNFVHPTLRPLGNQVFFSSVTLVLILTFPSNVSDARAVRCRNACSAAKASICAPLIPPALSPPRLRGQGEYRKPPSSFPSQRSKLLFAYVGSHSILEAHRTLWNVRGRLQKQQLDHWQEQRPRRRQPLHSRQHGAFSVFGGGQSCTQAACRNVSSDAWRGCTQPPIFNAPLPFSSVATVVQVVRMQQVRLQSGESALRLHTCRPHTVASNGATQSLSGVFRSSVALQPPVDNTCGTGLAAASSSDACAPVYSVHPSIVLGDKSATQKPHGSQQHPHTTYSRETETLISSSVPHISPHALSGSGECIGIKEGASNTGPSLVATSTSLEEKALLFSTPEILSGDSLYPGRLPVSEPGKENSIAAEHYLPFPRLGLFPNFVEALGNLGVRTATEIQQLCLPAILSGADVVLGAETGSGKTLGYLLGILQNVLIQKIIHERKEDEAMMTKDELPLPRHYPYAVVVVPTRELALQVVAWSRRLCKKTSIRTQLLLGSYTRWPFGTLTLPTSPDIILCTPQVLAGFATSRGIRKKPAPVFEHTQMLVLDEADMLLEGGYKKMMESVFSEFRKTDRMLTSSGKRRTQYVFAAATIPERGPTSIRKTIATLCPEATFLCTDSLHRQRPELLQDFIEIPADASFEERTNMLLDRLRKISPSDAVMIFCNTAHTAKRILQALEKELPPAANPKLFSSDLDHKDRARNLALFARGKSKVLVCTDAASRGLDIVGVTVVIQYDFARDAMTHLHRVGRVARAGKFGKAINFYDAMNQPLVDSVRQAACDPARSPLTDAFSRKRSFRKTVKKGQNSSNALVVDCPSPAVAVQSAAQGVKE